jgi:predicted PurR-regulated permease PerM
MVFVIIGLILLLVSFFIWIGNNADKIRIQIIKARIKKIQKSNERIDVIMSDYQKKINEIENKLKKDLQKYK